MNGRGGGRICINVRREERERERAMCACTWSYQCSKIFCCFFFFFFSAQNCFYGRVLLLLLLLLLLLFSWNNILFHCFVVSLFLKKYFCFFHNFSYHSWLASEMAGFLESTCSELLRCYWPLLQYRFICQSGSDSLFLFCLTVTFRSMWLDSSVFVFLTFLRGLIVRTQSALSELKPALVQTHVAVQTR